jgi:hypothetical protein
MSLEITLEQSRCAPDQQMAGARFNGHTAGTGRGHLRRELQDEAEANWSARSKGVGGSGRFTARKGLYIRRDDR